ncbi:MAG: GNAT family N-acetyltransferase [Acidimicrobiia bacterium]|nr:GNAT family N-acetyltransferase [Acidimicrobiia bacterium]
MDDGFSVLVSTEQITIRRFIASDIETLHAYRNHPEIGKQRSWLMPWEYDDTVMFVAEMAMRDPLFERGEWAHLAIERVGHEGLIGDIGVLWQVDDDVAEVVFTLAPDHRSLGVMTESIQAICTEITESLSLRLVAAVVEIDNDPARYLLERCGFAPVALDGEEEVVYAWRTGGWPMKAAKKAGKKAGKKPPASE